MPTKTDRVLAHQLREVVTVLNRNIRKQYSNPQQLSVAERNVIRILVNQDTATPSEMCVMMSISSQFMSQVLNRLEELDLICRKPSLYDRRKSEVTLTKNARKAVDISRSEKEEWLAAIISKQYSSEEKECIKKALDLLGDMCLRSV
jgi:DNA-binding MarR family transcriptional regulator